jgi:peptidoglycan/xylan/chitin deacetylase (PgdA/CDA1 family)
MLSSNPKRHPNRNRPTQTIIKIIPADAVHSQPAKKHTIIRSALAHHTDNLDVSEIGSESPVAHISTIPLVAVPTYKTLPITSTPRHKQQANASHTPTGQKILYMTFDDGPLRGTSNLLNVIKEEQVQATMFYIGRNVVHAPQLFQRAVSMPNVLVANHTYTHANNHYQRFYTSSVQNVVQDIDKAQNVIGGAKYMRLCGRDVWRLPHVHRNDWAISVAERGREIDKYDALANRGYFIYGWDIEWLFSHTTQKPLYSGAEMARRVNLQYRSGRTVKKGKIILLAHDFMWRSASNVRQLRTFIRIMKAQGWTFRTIDSYSDVTPAVYVRNHVKHPEKVKAPTKLVSKPVKPATATTPTVITLAPKAQHPHTAKIGKITLVTPSDLARQLAHAIRKQHFLAVRQLIAKGANVNARDTAGDIPLNLAIQTNNAVLVRMLVERGANIFNVDGHGMSPMGVAREHHNTIIIRYLIKQIAKQKQHRLHKTPFSMEA